VARESSQVHNEAWGSSQVHNEAWGHTALTFTGNITSLILNGFSVALIPFDIKIKIKKTKTAIVQRYKIETKYLEREGVANKKGKVILYKKTSHDFKTQEKTINETIWTIGSMLEHPAWNPDKSEYGEGKYHACSHPYFCDDFRNEKGDKYIAVEIAVKDLYEWPNPKYPHKIAFRKGKVLYEVDKYGKEL
jgi:hypothetical protein